MKHICAFVFTLLFCGLSFNNSLFSQNTGEQDTLKLSQEECEALFLKNNLSILAENINISKAEALVIQAKTWPNPNLTIDQVNLWKPENQIGGQEVVPPLTKDFGRNQQFAITIEQTILTAGKRKKLKALRQVGVEKQEQYFQELLRNLKLGLRMHLNELSYAQSIQRIYLQQLQSVQQLTQSYQNQLDAGYLKKGEYIRLKATELELQNQINQIENKMSALGYDLKLLMNIPIATHLVLKTEDVKPDQFQSFNTLELIEKAQNNRPDYKLGNLNQKFAESTLAVERAERVPNFSIQGQYDRGSGIYTDFIGFGISMDLPIFNRNKGNIKVAELEIKQTEIVQELITSTIEKEVNLAFLQYRKALNFVQQIDDGYETELDQMLTAYTQNFMKRNINLIKYLDFLKAYLENKEILLQAYLDLRVKTEQLNYAVGTDNIK